MAVSKSADVAIFFDSSLRAMDELIVALKQREPQFVPAVGGTVFCYHQNMLYQAKVALSRFDHVVNRHNRVFLTRFLTSTGAAQRRQRLSYTTTDGTKSMPPLIQSIIIISTTDGTSTSRLIACFQTTTTRSGSGRRLWSDSKQHYRTYTIRLIGLRQESGGGSREAEAEHDCRRSGKTQADRKRQQ